MPKNKGKHKSERAKEPDVEQQIATLTERVLEYVRPHLMKILALTVTVVVVVGGFSIWTMLKEHKEADATAAFGQVMTEVQKPVDEALPDPYAPPPDPDAPKFKTYKERSEAALAEADKLESAHGSSEVAAQALLVEAGLDYDLAKYDDALKAYQRFLDKGAHTPRLVELAHEGIGYATEAKALAETDAGARTSGLQNALKAYQAIEPDETGPYYAISAYHQARVTALLGDSKGAIALYKKSLDKAPPIGIRAEISMRLALLEPNPAPAAPAPAPVPAPK